MVGQRARYCVWEVMEHRAPSLWLQHVRDRCLGWLSWAAITNTMVQHFLRTDLLQSRGEWHRCMPRSWLQSALGLSYTQSQLGADVISWEGSAKWPVLIPWPTNTFLRGIMVYHSFLAQLYHFYQLTICLYLPQLSSIRSPNQRNKRKYYLWFLSISRGIHNLRNFVN